MTTLRKTMVFTCESLLGALTGRTNGHSKRSGEKIEQIIPNLSNNCAIDLFDFE